MAGEAHPVPFRTRKLSPRAPMVLRRSPWESRTSLTNKGHFRVPAEGPARGPLFVDYYRSRSFPRRRQSTPPGVRKPSFSATTTLLSHEAEIPQSASPRVRKEGHPLQKRRIMQKPWRRGLSPARGGRARIVIPRAATGPRPTTCAAYLENRILRSKDRRDRQAKFEF